MPWFISDITMTSGFVLCSFFVCPNSFLFWPLFIVEQTVIELCVTTPVLHKQPKKLGAHCIFTYLGYASFAWITLLLSILNSINWFYHTKLTWAAWSSSWISKDFILICFSPVMLYECCKFLKTCRHLICKHQINIFLFDLGFIFL